MLSPATKRNIFRITPFGLICFLFSIVYTLLERGVLGSLTYYPSTGNPYSFGKAIFITPLTGFIAGLLIGSIEILYLNKLFIKQSFFIKIFCKTIIYLGLITFILLSMSVIANSAELKTSNH